MDDKKSYYAIIPANVRYDPKLKDKAKLLYGEITALCNEKGYCWATNKYFADLYGVSKTTISILIKNLIDNGYITSKVKYKDGTKEILNRYLSIIEYPIKENLNTPIKEKLKDNNTSLNNTSNKKESKKENKKSKEPSFNELIENYTSDEKIRSLLKEWLKVRKAKRAALTNKAIELNLNKLERLAKESNMNINTYLEEVIARGWAAFYAIKNYQVNNKPTRKEVVPEWYNKKFENEPLTGEDKATFEKEAAELQEMLKNKY